MRPPRGFVTALHNLDPELSLRYSGRMGMWVIERRARRMPETEVRLLTNRVRRFRAIANNPDHPQFHLGRKMLARTEEELTSAKANKYAVMFTRELNPRAYDLLCAQDIQRNGGAEAVALKIEEDERKKAADQDRMNQNEMHALHLETFDILNFIWRKKETQLLHGERDLRKMLHGTRTKQGDEPLIKLALA